MSTGGKRPLNFFSRQQRRPPPPVLSEEEFLDHQQQPALRLWYLAHDLPDDADEVNEDSGLNNNQDEQNGDGKRVKTTTSPLPLFSFQVYINASIPELKSNSKKLIDYLFGPMHEDFRNLPARIEVYSLEASLVTDDPIICVDHQRREIANRAQLFSESSSKSREHDRRIPRYRRSDSDMPQGHLVIINSASSLQYNDLVTVRGTNDSHGPLLVTFDRKEKNATADLGPLQEMLESSGESSFESLEVSCYRCRTAEAVTEALLRMAYASGANVDNNGLALAFEPEDDESVAAGLISLVTTAETVLESVDINLQHDSAEKPYVVVARPSSATPDSSSAPSPDLKYIIYVPTDTKLSKPALTSYLSSAGKAFTHLVLQFWPQDISFRLSFYSVPPSESPESSLQAILSHTRAEYDTNPDQFTTGYLAPIMDKRGNVSGTSRRVPGSVIAGVEKRRRFREFKRFVVVLERAKVSDTSENAASKDDGFGVLFVLDGQQQWGMDMGIDREEQSGLELMVRRPIGRQVMAERLAGML